MKKFLTLFLTFLLTLSICACGNKEQLAAYESTIASLESDAIAYQEEIDSLKKQIEEYENEIASLEENLSSLQTEEVTIEEVEEPASNTDIWGNRIPVQANGVYTVPAGCSYITCDNVTYNEGDSLQGSQIQEGDRLFTDVYVYEYILYDNAYSYGWQVSTINKSSETYPDIENYMDIPVLSLLSAFQDCENLTTVPTIPDTVVNMSCAFSQCDNLKEVTYLPPNLVDMTSTFWECSSLESVPDIPEGVKTLWAAFHGCKSLKNAPKLPSSVETLYDTFYGCTALETAPAIPENVTDIQGMFYGCTALKTAPVIPMNVTCMLYTFTNCKSLTGEIIINANPSQYNDFFQGVNLNNQGITLSGDSLMLDALAETGE